MVLQRGVVYIQADWLGFSWHSFIRVLIGSYECYTWVYALAESVHQEVVFTLLQFCWLLASCDTDASANGIM